MSLSLTPALPTSSFSSATSSTLEEKTSPFSPKPKKDSRQVFSYNTNHTPSCRANSSSEEEGTIQHAFFRIQLFYLEAEARYGTGLRSDGTKQPICLKVSGARKQGGKGSLTHHAAHPNTVSGLTDNVRELFSKQIKDENRLTPKKSDLIKAISGCTDEELDALTDANIDFDEVFNQIWPIDFAEESLLERSRFHNIANTTNELPVALNLNCDVPLERSIRTKVAELFKRIMHSEVGPTHATQEYVKMILDHFDEVIPLITTAISHLEEYKKEFSAIFTAGNLEKARKNVKERDKLRKNISKLIKKVQLLHDKLSFASSQPSSSSFPINKEFLDECIRLIKDGKLAQLDKYVRDNLSKTKRELTDTTSELNEILDYNEWERKGTCTPEYEKLTGFYNKATNTHEMLSPSKKGSVKRALFRAPTPQKKSKHASNPPTTKVALFHGD